MRYAIVDENNVVINVAVAEEPLADNWIEANVSRGAVYDPVTQTFTPPNMSAANRPVIFAAKTEEVKTEAGKRLELGALHNGTRWPADFQSQMEKSAVAASIGAGKGMPKGQTSLTVRNMQRTKVAMTQAEYLNMASAIRDYVFEVKEVGENHVDALIAIMSNPTKTNEDLQNYDVTVGWPE